MEDLEVTRDALSAAESPAGLSGKRRGYRLDSRQADQMMAQPSAFSLAARVAKSGA